MSYTMPPWSYTALTNFESCPHKYFETRIAKSVLDLPGEAAIWGDRVHKALEASVKEGSPLPEGMEHWQKYADKFRQMADVDGATVIAEQQLAINKLFEPVEWDSPDAWCRGIIDIAVLKNRHMVAADWKTGKRKSDSTQLMLFAGLCFAHYKVDVVDTMFLWLKEGKTDRRKYTLEDKAEIWNTFLPRVRKMELAFEEDKWEKRTSGLCRGWCPVKSCEHNQPRR